MANPPPIYCTIMIEYDNNYNIKQSVYGRSNETEANIIINTQFLPSITVNLNGKNHVELFLNLTNGDIFYKPIDASDFNHDIQNPVYKRINVNVPPSFNIPSASYSLSTENDNMSLIDLTQIKKIQKYVIPNKTTSFNINDKVYLIKFDKSKKTLPSIETIDTKNEYIIQSIETSVALSDRIPVYPLKHRSGLLKLKDTSDELFDYTYSVAEYPNITSTVYNSVIYKGSLVKVAAPAAATDDSATTLNRVHKRLTTSTPKPEEYILYIEKKIYDIKLKTINNSIVKSYFSIRNLPFIKYIKTNNENVYGCEPIFYLDGDSINTTPSNQRITYEVINNYIEQNQQATHQVTYQIDKYYKYHSYGSKTLKMYAPTISKHVQITDLSYDNMYDIFIYNGNFEHTNEKTYLNYEYKGYTFYLKQLTSDDYTKEIASINKKTYNKGGGSITYKKYAPKNTPKNKTKRIQTKNEVTILDSL